MVKSGALFLTRNPSTYFYATKLRCTSTPESRTALAADLKLVLGFASSKILRQLCIFHCIPIFFTSFSFKAAIKH